MASTDLIRELDHVYEILAEHRMGAGFFWSFKKEADRTCYFTTRQPSITHPVHSPVELADVDFLMIGYHLRLIDGSLAETVWIDQELSENAAARFMAETFDMYFECILTQRGIIRGHDTLEARNELFAVAFRLILKRIKDLGKTAQRSIKRNVRLPKHTTDTSRLAYLDDMPLFSNLPYFRLGGGKSSKGRTPCEAQRKKS